MLKTAREEREMAQKERQDVEYNLGHTKDELGKAKNEYRQVGTDGEGGITNALVQGCHMLRRLSVLGV